MMSQPLTSCHPLHWDPISRLGPLLDTMKDIYGL